MAKIILGDVHGRTVWKPIVESAGPEVDTVIFLGDYLDPYTNWSPFDVLENLKDIVAYKNSTSNKVVLLLGNHDFHYMPFTTDRYSRYKPYLGYEQYLQNNLDEFEIAYVDKDTNVLYTHAGVSSVFLNSLVDSDMLKNPLTAVSVANILIDTWQRKPEKFEFKGVSSAWGQCIEEGPLWIRPESLAFAPVSRDITQVVGHTPNSSDKILSVDKEGKPVSVDQDPLLIFADALPFQYLYQDDEGNFHSRDIII